jgi:hypothetical protein
MKKIFTRVLDRRLAHLEEVIDARSAEQIAALEQLARRLDSISDSHRDLAENITEIIESHLAFHVQSMIEVGAILAEARGLNPSTAAESVNEGTPGIARET